ncbi:acyltransferase [Neorhizobium sp. CSC1952]|uniref:acyltransferase family protein n=1 Tax=Neorhizobium sp. CSC1952 TaxID=2978974 RepID=UPI0025A50E1B|nr:acyltransferase [Rhizobium sp. CSC1952]WJR69117.1 acyltransferase [Rhizobium sp. CSC1952]
MTAPKAARLLNLDILRLISALMVLTFHYGFRMRISGEGGGIGFPELAPLAMWFDTGLLIFFAISGYVITMSAEGRSAYDFAVGRFARLWPTFIVCATITAVVLSIWHMPTIEPPTFKQWLAHLVIISRALGQPFLDGAYWTIAYEIIFYGWVFVMIAAGFFERGWRAVVLAWLTISVVNEAVVGSGAIQKLLITEYSGYFAFGLALYKVQKHFSIANLCVLGAAACWAIVTPFLTEPDFVETYGLGHSVIGLALSGPAALGAMTLAASAPSLRIRPAVAIGLGGLTYPLYLLHQNIGYAVFARFGTEQSRWLVALVLIAILLFGSWAIARTIEPTARRTIIRAAGQVKDGLGRLKQRTA